MAKGTVTRKVQYQVEADAKGFVKTFRRVAKEVEKTESKTKKLDHTVKKTERSTKDLAGAWQGFRKTAQGSGTVLGQITNDLSDLGEGILEVSSASGGLGTVTVALGAVGAAAVAQTALMAGLVTAFFRATMALDGLVTEAVDAAREMEELGIVLDDDVRANLDAAEAASLRLHAGFDLLQIKMATELTPTFVGMSNALVTATYNVGELTSATTTLKDDAIDGLAESLGYNEESIEGWRELIGGGVEVAEAFAKATALNATGLSLLTPLFTENADEALAQAGAIDDARVSTELSTEAVKLAAEAEKEKRDAIRESMLADREQEEGKKKDMEAQRRRADERAKIVDRAISDEERRVDAIIRHLEREQKAQEITDAKAAALAKKGTAGIIASNEAKAAAADAYTVARQSQSADMITMAVAEHQQLKDLAISLLQVKIDSLDTSTRAGRAEAMKMFAAQKALAISQAVVTTALAVNQNLGAYPLPWAWIPAGIAMAAGTANIALIAAQQPNFAVGGVVPQSVLGNPGSVAGHGLVQAAPGEAFLNTGATRDIGGQRGVDDANRRMGGGGGMSITVIQKYNHRAFGAFTEDHLQMDTPMSRRFDRGKKPGHSRGRF